MSSSSTAPLERSIVPPRRSLPPWLRVLRLSLRYGRTRVGLVVVLLMVGLAVFGPALAPYSPSALVDAPFAGPSSNALLGTDYLGEDVLSRVLWGGRTVLWMSVAATVLGVGVGVLLGLIVGYSRNVLDDVIMRTLDVVYVFPQIVLVLLFVSLLGPKLWLIVVLVGIAWVPGIARITRVLTLDAVGKEFVEAAEVIAVPRRRILLHEVLPNLVTPLTVEFGLRLTWSIGAVAAVSFLGFGVQPPTADWGLMINQNRNGLAVQPLTVLVPVCCIAAFTIGTNLIADGIARSAAGIDRGSGRRARRTR